MRWTFPTFVENSDDYDLKTIDVISQITGISKSETRRLMKAGAIKFDGYTTTQPVEESLLFYEAPHDKGLLKVGKRKMFVYNTHVEQTPLMIEDYDPTNPEHQNLPTDYLQNWV
jgi:hypothetical protein